MGFIHGCLVFQVALMVDIVDTLPFIIPLHEGVFILK